jgi:FkbM family methyltransferase
VRILVHSNAPWAGSGYGTQTAILAKRLPELGHEVVVSAMHGLDSRPLDWDGTLVLPSGMRAYSNDTIGPHARRVFGDNPGLVLVLYDMWAIDPAPLRQFATAAWTPIQSHPVPPADLEFFAASGALPIAMSRYGQREMTEVGLQPIYVPHAVDTGVFAPLPDADRAVARQMLDIEPDAFVIAIVAANKDKTPPRKAWGEQFQAFKLFRQRHPDVRLLVHTLLDTPNGINLVALVHDLGIGDAVQFTDQYAQVTGLYAPQDMAGIYGCADVLSNCSWAEGFGLPVIEAQACGVPVVVSDGSAMTELCGSGWLVDTQPYWHPYARSWWHAPLIESIVDAWEQAYQHARDPQVREQAREFAMGYDADTVMTQYWKPALEMLEQYAGAVPVRPPNRNHGTIPLPTVEADGLNWIQRGGHTDDWIAVNHEDSLARVLDGLLPTGGVFIDVGAHVGRWALRMAGKASRVIAVEPNPATAAVLRAHIALNDIENVDVLEMAAWDSQTRLGLSDPKGAVTSGSSRVGEDSNGTVDALPLDDVLFAVNPDLIKLDVEGADLHALRGMRDTLARCKPALFIEDHSIYGFYQRAELEAVLHDLGYNWREVHGYQSADGQMVQAPYLICTPADRIDAFNVALQAIERHHASQRPDELAEAVRLIAGLSPSIVVEIGCDAGGTLYAWRQVCDEVLGITLADNSHATAGQGLPLTTHGATVHVGDSRDPESLRWLTGQLAGRHIDALVIDGDHTAPGVRADLAMYGPLVRPGGLILLHDIASTDDPRAEVWKVWPDLTEHFETSEIRSVDRPYGWGIVRVRERDTWDLNQKEGK